MSESFKLIVISSTDGFEHEIRHVQQMFEEGLELFHLRKPKFSTRKMREYLERISSEYHSRIVIHSHHELAARFSLRGIHFTRKHLRKNFAFNWLRLQYLRLAKKKLHISTGFHTLSDLKVRNKRYDYVFLSPIFPSVSKIGYASSFNKDSLREVLNRTSYNVIALGGIDEDNIEQAREWGFDGVAALGSIWRAKDPVEKFKQLKVRCTQLVNT